MHAITKKVCTFTPKLTLNDFNNIPKVSKEMETKEFTAKAGGGAVEVTVTGKKEVVSVKISEEAVDPDDVETLEDMVKAAVNEALKQADAANAEMMGRMTGGLGGLPF